MKLNNIQEKAISLLASSALAEKFYWTGGTLLAYHYLHHRKSLGLDFLAKRSFHLRQLISWLRKLENMLVLKE